MLPITVEILPDNAAVLDLVFLEGEHLDHPHELYLLLG
jgi:hypothetical protein